MFLKSLAERDVRGPSSRIGNFYRGTGFLQTSLGTCLQGSLEVEAVFGGKQ
jgi:hypothetical protein